MSVSIDDAAITAATARVVTANGRHAASYRRERGVTDPQVRDDYSSELNAALIKRCILTTLAKRPNLSMPHRLELIEELMPTDSTEADQVLHQLACESRGILTPP